MLSDCFGWIHLLVVSRQDSQQQSARSRLMRFFSSLYTVLKRGARAALQFYPENADQVVLITECASRVGFQGGLVVDYPNSSKAKKYYLCLSFETQYRVPKVAHSGTSAGRGQRTHADPDRVDDSQALGTGDDAVGVTERERQRGGKKKGGQRPAVKSRDWILQKKVSTHTSGPLYIYYIHYIYYS